MQAFVLEKKKKNPLKYHQKSLINFRAAPVPKGTLSIMLNVNNKTALPEGQRKKEIT